MANHTHQKNESRVMMAIFQPEKAFAELSYARISPSEIFFKYAIWLLLCPPLFLWLGGFLFGWHIGAEEPVYLDQKELLIASSLYFVALLFGFFSTTLISRWMADTYGATTSLAVHMALISIIGAPLAIISAIHLFPHIVLNLLAIIMALAWSMYLLYTGLPVVLKTSGEKGMLMASALVGWLLVASVSLLGITLLAWVSGLGPLLGV